MGFFVRRVWNDPGDGADFKSEELVFVDVLMSTGVSQGCTSGEHAAYGNIFSVRLGRAGFSFWAVFLDYRSESLKHTIGFTL